MHHSKKFSSRHPSQSFACERGLYSILGHGSRTTASLAIERFSILGLTKRPRILRLKNHRSHTADDFVRSDTHSPREMSTCDHPCSQNARKAV